MCNDNKQSVTDTDMLWWQVKWHPGLLIIIMKLSCNIYVLYSSQSLLGILPRIAQRMEPVLPFCFVPKSLPLPMRPQHTRREVWHNYLEISFLLQSLFHAQKAKQTKSLNSNNDAICANLWITFQLKQTCCWQQFLDIFYCHMHSFCIYKVQQDFHGGGCQALDIHTGFIFLRELQIKRET